MFPLRFKLIKYFECFNRLNSEIRILTQKSDRMKKVPNDTQNPKRNERLVFDAHSIVQALENGEEM